MASSQELSDFLRDVERRAFKQTVYAVRDEHAALDIVQDAMLKLAEKYATKPAEEYPMLFQRILQNTMARLFGVGKKYAIYGRPYCPLLLAMTTRTMRDPLETIDVEDNSENPAEQLQRNQTIAIVEKALEKLPPRQREAFVLRYWEDMDVAETAEIMGCSQRQCQNTLLARSACTGPNIRKTRIRGIEVIVNLGVELRESNARQYSTTANRSGTRQSYCRLAGWSCATTGVCAH